MQLQISKKAIIQTILLVGINIVSAGLLLWIEDTIGLKSIESENEIWVRESPVSFIIIAVIFAPMVEEYAFRYILKKEKYLITAFILSTLYFLLAGETKVLLISMLSLNLLIGFFLFIRKCVVVPIWVVGYSIAVFAAMHSINFKMEDMATLNNVELFFLFLPYVLIAGNFTYIRFKHGFSYSVFGHMLYNAILLSIYFLNQ